MLNHRLSHIFAFALILAAPWTQVLGDEPATAPGVFHVSPAGNDANSGSSQSPLLTLPAAMKNARTWRQAHPGAKITILLATGEYVLDQPMVLTPDDSNLRIAAEEDAKPVLTSCQEITGWTKLVDPPIGLSAGARGKVWVADIPKGVHFETLLVNGQRAKRSCSNDAYSWRQWGGMTFSFTPPDKDGRQTVTFKDKNLLKYLSSDGDAEMVYILEQWKNPGYGIITDVNVQQGTARVWTAGQPLGLFRGGRETDFRIENDPSFIDDPGEWAANSTLGKVYYWPTTPDMSTWQAQFPRLISLISIQGEPPPRQVHTISIQGITFTGTDRPRMGQDPGPNATLAIDNATGCLVDHCRFLCNGSANDVLVTGNYSSDNHILHCEMGWGGGSGVALKGISPWAKENQNGQNEAAFNHIYHNGIFYWNASGITLSNTRANQVHHNFIEQSSYANIAINGGLKPKLQLLLKDPAARTALFAQMAERDNVIQKNVCVEPCSYLEEGGSLYATSAQHDLYDQNLIYKSGPMPGSSVIAMDDVAEFSTITANVLWLEGQPLNIVGMRPYTLETKVLGNIECGFKPAYKERKPGSLEKPDWCTKEDDLKSFNTLWKQIEAEANQAGGWPGNPQLRESIMQARQNNHITLTPDEIEKMHSVIE